MPAASADVEVVLLKADRTKIRYSAELLADDGTRITVRALDELERLAREGGGFASLLTFG
jgi:hypothetical protein